MWTFGNLMERWDIVDMVPLEEYSPVLHIFSTLVDIRYLHLQYVIYAIMFT